MHGEEGLAAGRCAAVDGDMNEYFLDLTHCRAASQRASRIDRELLIPTQRRENAQGQQRLRLAIKRRPAPRPPPRQLGDEVLERHHELIRPSQVRVDELIAEHLAPNAQPSVEILAGGHSGDDTGSNWLNHGSQVENEPAEACGHAAPRRRYLHPRHRDTTGQVGARRGSTPPRGGCDPYRPRRTQAPGPATDWAMP